MGQDRVDDALFAQVPNFHGVVIAACRHLEAVGKEADGDHLPDVGGELENVLATPQIPDQPYAMQVSSAEQAAIDLEGHREDGP